ncbi:hypothetical protein [Paramagnetospirillum marisnigri]|uniref:hypothetical protein n=1 Tax=Paramagnetospirillum marisnigri TaxID=1285242 RepID=UPI0015608192|nr:hypothetical protein [Paramagnetospirillum marisnigri]
MRYPTDIGEKLDIMHLHPEQQLTQHPAQTTISDSNKALTGCKWLHLEDLPLSNATDRVCIEALPRPQHNPRIMRFTGYFCAEVELASRAIPSFEHDFFAPPWTRHILRHKLAAKRHLPSEHREMRAREWSRHTEFSTVSTTPSLNTIPASYELMHVDSAII